MGTDRIAELAQARAARLHAEESLRLSELEVNLCKWQRRLQDMESRLDVAASGEARLADWEHAIAAGAAGGGTGGMPPALMPEVDTRLQQTVPAPVAHVHQFRRFAHADLP